MGTPLPPIYRDCRRLLAHTEDMVRRFSRYHKYTVGTDLRRAAMQMMRTVSQAVHDKPGQWQHLQALSVQVDDYRLTLQLCMDVGAFAQSVRGRGAQQRPAPAFHAFEQAATLLAAIGKQCGGWRSSLQRRQRARQVAGVDTPAPPAHAGGAGAAASAGPKPGAMLPARPVSPGACAGPLHGGQDKRIWAVCGVAKPRRATGPGCVLRLAAHPKPLAAHSRRGPAQAPMEGAACPTGANPRPPRPPQAQP